MNFPCEGCQQLYDGWLLHTHPANRWMQYPKSYERSNDARKAQIADTWDLKRRQCDAVIESCRAKGCLEERKAA